MSHESLCGIEIAGYGSALPDTVVTNQDLIDLWHMEGKTPADINRVTGIDSRHWAENPKSKDTGAKLAAAAGRAALENAGLEPSQISSLILATTTPDQRVPAMSARVSQLLELNGAAACDINAACSGFTYGINDGYRRIHCGEGRTLVIGCDVLTRIISDDPEEWRNGVLFGDGAGAVVLQRNGDRPQAGLLGWHETANGSLVDILSVDHDKPVHMDGGKVYQNAIRLMPAVGRQAIAEAGLEPADIDLVVPHQANLRIIQECSKSLDIPMDKMVWSGKEHGNTSSASIPLALADALNDGRLQRGDKLLLVGFGAGMTAAASVIHC